jgi:hypothetical protein
MYLSIQPCSWTRSNRESEGGDLHPVAEVGRVLGRAERVDEALERGDGRVDPEDARGDGLRRAASGARLQVLEAHPSSPQPARIEEEWNSSTADRVRPGERGGF